MTRESRIGMMVGLVFIVMFGLVICELAGPGPQRPRPAAGAPRERDSLDAAPLFEPAEERVEVPLAAGSDAGGAREEGSVNVAMLPMAERSRGGVVESRVHAGEEESRAETRTPHRRESPARSRGAARRRRPAGRTYTTVAGDSLIRIARKTYGREHAQQYRRIYEANRNVLRSPSVVPVGVRLVIPPLEGEGEGDSAAPPAASGVRGNAGAALEQVRRHVSGRAAGRRYVTRRGDTLTAIARKTMGGAGTAAVRRLYAANRDVLRNPNVVPVGVTLTIPE